jgi:hypothetical protein
MSRRLVRLPLVGLVGVLCLLTPLVQPLDAEAYGTFRQDQRINSLTLQFAIDSFATQNAFGGAFGSTFQGQIQSPIASSITSGATSLLFEMPGLSDLTGTNEASLQAGVVNAVPVNPTGPYNGNSDLDWWYAPRGAELDLNDLPKAQLTGFIAAKALTLAGPSINLVFSLGSVNISSVHIAAVVGPSSTPTTSPGYYPPGHPASDQIDPTLQSFASMSSGQLKGNISAASLAAAPIPASLTGATTCSQNYTTANSWLDVLVSGCTAFGLVTVVRATQPDQADPAARPVGNGAPFHLSANSSHVVDVCTDKNSITVNLTACLQAAAYSSYFKFTTDRVIGKGPQWITPPGPPANPMVGGSNAETAIGGASGNPVIVSADAASTPGACTVSSGVLVSFTGVGTCIVDFDQAGNGIYFAAPRVQLALNVTLPPAVAVLPAVSNGAYGGYVTATTIQNAGSAPAYVQIVYYDQSGAPVGAGDAINNLPMNASWTVRQDNGNSFPSSGGDAVQAGSAVVYSSQPVAAFVNEFAPGNVGDATSYTGVQVATGVGTTLYAPTIVNNAYGGYTTGIGLLNEGSGPTDVTITYRDGGGAVVKTQTVTALAAHAYHALYSGDTALALPSGFAGTATIVSSAGPPLGAVVNETGLGGQFSSYDAVPAASTTLYAPVALRNAFGGYNTGMGIVNTTATVGAVTFTYYDSGGAATVTTALIAANGYLGVYQGTDIPTDGAYTARITSSVAVAAIVNEVAPSNTSAMQSTSYNTFSAGGTTLHLPLVENAGSDPWNTGEGIMNTGSSSTTVTVNYYDTGTGAAIGTAQTLALAPHAFWGLYQPSGGLPSGKRATVVITTSSGGQVAVICNESSSTTFMSYDGQ